LCDISLPSTITKIGAGAFAGCRNLSGINLPPYLKCIDVQTFDSCRNLTHVLIPNNIEEIGNMAFMSTNLSSVSLPQNLKKIGGMAFAGAPLASINSKSSRFKVDDMTIYSIDGKELVQYYGHDSMFEIPETVVKIADFAFAFAYTLREIVIPDSIKEIGKSFLLEISPDKIYVASEMLKSMVIERTPSWSHINIIVEKS
jgi:hypothetical protein